VGGGGVGRGGAGRSLHALNRKKVQFDVVKEREEVPLGDSKREKIA